MRCKQDAGSVGQRRQVLRSVAGACAALAGLPLVACAPAQPSDEAQKELSKTIGSDRSSAALYAALSQHAAYFALEGPGSMRVPLWVMFDPQCPHCGRLWKLVRSLERRRATRWVPVAILRQPTSLIQGARLLAGPDSVRAMDEHEDLLSKGSTGIAARDTDPLDQKKVLANTAIFKLFELSSVPYPVSQGPSGIVAGQQGLEPGALVDLLAP